MIIITGLTNWYHIFQRLPQHVSCWDFIVNGGTFHLRLAKHREREAVVNLSSHIHFKMNFHSEISLGWLVVAIMMEKGFFKIMICRELTYISHIYHSDKGFCLYLWSACRFCKNKRTSLLHSYDIWHYLQQSAKRRKHFCFSWLGKSLGLDLKAKLYSQYY